MDFFPLGDLERYITDDMVEQDARLISSQLLSGLEILHSQCWAHRDLKPANIFVTQAAPNWWVKIGDFGLSKRSRVGMSGTQTFGLGTNGYIAPESLHLLLPAFEDQGSEEEDSEEAECYSTAVDMWSLGCIVYRLLTRALPFKSDKVLRSYCRSKSKFPVQSLQESHASNEAIGLIRNLLVPLPKQRLTALEASLQSWFSVLKPPLEASEIRPSDNRALPLAKNAEYSQKDKPEHQDLERMVQDSLLTASAVTECSTSESEDEPQLTPQGSNWTEISIAHRESKKDSDLGPPKTPTKDMAQILATLKDSSLTKLSPSNKDVSTPLSDADALYKELSECLGSLGEEQSELSTVWDSYSAFQLAWKGFEEKLPLWETLLEAQKKELGRNSAKSLLLMTMLGKCYRSLDYFEEAHKIQRQAWALAKSRYGLEDSITIMITYERGVSFFKSSRPREALELLEQSYASYWRSCGFQDLKTRASAHYIGSITSFGKLQEQPAAISKLRVTFETRKKRLGDGHIDTVDTADSLAAAVYRQGKFHEALNLRQKVWVCRNALLGEGHPKTMVALDRLGVALCRLQKKEEELSLLRRNLELQKQVLGRDHVQTLVAMNRFAWELHFANQDDEALAAFKRYTTEANAIWGENFAFELKQGENASICHARLYAYLKMLPAIQKLLSAGTKIDKDSKYYKEILKDGLPCIGLGL